MKEGRAGVFASSGMRKGDQLASQPHHQILDRWDVFTNITRSPTGTYEVNIRLGCAWNGHSGCSSLPAIHGFSSPQGAAAFIMSWISEWRALNGDA
jgi:hypothetical protein